MAIQEAQLLWLSIDPESFIDLYNNGLPTLALAMTLKRSPNRLLTNEKEPSQRQELPNLQKQ